jgi:hypothetical protein
MRSSRLIEKASEDRDEAGPVAERHVKRNYGLLRSTIDQMEDIRTARELPTETAALRDAVEFRWALAKVELAEVKLALRVVKQLRDLHEEGDRILLHHPDGSESRLILLGL